MSDFFDSAALKKRIEDLPGKVEIPKDMDERNVWWITYSPAVVNDLLNKNAALREALEDGVRVLSVFESENKTVVMGSSLTIKKMMQALASSRPTGGSE